MAKISFKQILSSITGISTPVFGVSWKPPKSERQVVRRFVNYLEDRRVLFTGYSKQGLPYTPQSVLKIREKVTKAIDELPEDSKAGPPLRAIRAACRRFLENMESITRQPGVMDGALIYLSYETHRDRRFLDRFYQALGQFRATVGIHLAQLAVQYGINVEEELASILPPVDEINE